MIVLFTDFGLHGPYTGQMKAVLQQMAPGTPVINLVCGCAGRQPEGVGLPAGRLCALVSGEYRLSLGGRSRGGGRGPAIIVKADGRWYVGPGNGLFELIQRRATEALSWDIDCLRRFAT